MRPREKFSLHNAFFPCRPYTADTVVVLLIYNLTEVRRIRVLRKMLTNIFPHAASLTLHEV